MCKDKGMSLAPWGALSGRYFKPKEQVHKDGGRNSPHVAAEQVTKVLERTTTKKGTLS